MKSLLAIFLATAISSFSPGVDRGFFNFKAEKYALLIGVAKYPPGSEWSQLCSDDDLDLLKNALILRGFKAENITTVLDEQASYAGIQRALAELQSRVQPGDVAFIHFSGHGQQVADDNGDEVDGLDEAYVCYDSPKNYAENGYHGEHLLRDEQLGQWMDRVRLKLGPQGHVLLTMDACHSGTGTRGLGVTRGTETIMAPAGYIAQVQTRPTDGPGLENTGGAALENAAPAVLLFSSGAHQLSHEITDENGRPFGAFSYALAKALADMTPVSTYSSAFEAIAKSVCAQVPRQSPQAEGDLDRLLLDGALRPVQASIAARTVHSGSLVTVGAGQMQGWTGGSTVALYPAGTMDTTGREPLAMGTIEEATAFNSDVIFERELDKKILSEGRYFLKVKNLGKQLVSVKLSILEGGLKASLESELGKYPFIALANETADLYLQSLPGLVGEQQLQLVSQADWVFWEKEPRKVSAEALALAVVRAAADFERARFLRALEIESTAYGAEFSILSKSANQRDWMAQNKAVLVGDSVQIFVKNTGSKVFYFSIVDIQPNNIATVLLPEMARVPADYFLKPDQVFTSQKFKVAPPLGEEFLKLVVGPEPLPLREIMETRGASARAQSGIESLFKSGFCPENASRGQTISIRSEPGLVQTLRVAILQK